MKNSTKLKKVIAELEKEYLDFDSCIRNQFSRNNNTGKSYYLGNAYFFHQYKYELRNKQTEIDSYKKEYSCMLIDEKKITIKNLKFEKDGYGNKNVCLSNEINTFNFEILKYAPSDFSLVISIYACERKNENESILGFHGVEKPTSCSSFIECKKIIIDFMNSSDALKSYHDKNGNRK